MHEGLQIGGDDRRWQLTPPVSASIQEIRLAVEVATGMTINAAGDIQPCPRSYGSGAGTCWQPRLREEEEPSNSAAVGNAHIK